MLDFSRCRLVPVPQDDGTILMIPPPQHVREGVEWIINQPYGVQGNDMGGMKSAQAIISTLFLFEQNVIDRAIVIAPAPVRPLVWYDPEIGELALHLWDDVPSLVTEYHQKIRQWRRGPEKAVRTLKWIVTNYEWIRKCDDKLETLLTYCTPRTVLILDESSAVRSHDSGQTDACMRLRWQSKKTRTGHTAIILGAPRCGRVLLLNGTPIAEGPEDMFSQGNILHPSILECRYITHYRNRYAIMEEVRGAGGRVLTDHRGNAIKKVKSWTNLEDLQQRFAPYILRQDWRKNAGLPNALPPQTLAVTLTPETWKAYKNMRDDMVHWLQSGDVAVTQTAAIKVMRLAQVTSGILGGVEKELPMDVELETGFLDSLDFGEPRTTTVETVPQIAMLEAPVPLQRLVMIGREKLDFALEWHTEALRQDPNLKLLLWFRFVPELKRHLEAVAERFNHPIGAVCGVSVFGGPVKKEREIATRLLHPRTAPVGPATVGGTYGTGGLGLNFTAFHTVMNVSQVYEDFKRRQADKRVDRPGQRHAVAQFDLVAVGPKGQKTIDHIIVAARHAKRDLNELTVSAWQRALLEE